MSNASNILMNRLKECRFFLPVQFSGRIAKSFLGNVLTLVIKEAWDQDLSHSLDTPKIFP